MCRSQAQTSPNFICTLNCCVQQILIKNNRKKKLMVLILLVTSEDTQSERRFDDNIPILNLKDRLEPVTGVSATCMKIELYDTSDKLISEELKEGTRLDDYGARNYYRLNVVNTDPYRLKNEFSDVSKVKKFELNDDEYEKRSDSVRDFLKRNKMGKYADKQEVKYNIAHVQMGSRCEVSSGNGDEDGMKKRGVVKYVGSTEFKEGVWVGVEYDEPIGKGDGSVDGIEYFRAKAKHAAFVRPDMVVCGDFPEVDEFDDLEEM